MLRDVVHNVHAVNQLISISTVYGSFLISICMRTLDRQKRANFSGAVDFNIFRPRVELLEDIKSKGVNR